MRIVADADVGVPLPSVSVADTFTWPALKDPPPYNVVVTWCVVPSQITEIGPPDIPLLAVSP